MDSHERSDPESYNIDVNSATNVKRRRKFMHPMAAITCLVAVVTLFVVVIYSHLILNAIHSNEFSGSLNINNISQRLDWLNSELHQIADNASRDNKNVKLAVDNIGKSMGNGVKGQEILNRLGEITRRGDQLLLEQIQTDRRINLKLEVVENNINILKKQIEADQNSNAQTKVFDEQQNHLEERNRQLETKLQHLESVLNENAKLAPDALRKEIENDSLLAPESEEAKSISEKAADIWNKLTNSEWSKSASGGHSSKIVFTIAGTVAAFLMHIGRFHL